MNTAKARNLFARRDRLKRELAAVEVEITEARREWSAAEGYRVPVRDEAFRRAVAL